MTATANGRPTGRTKYPFLIAVVTGSAAALLPIDPSSLTEDLVIFIFLNYVLFYFLVWNAWRATRSYGLRALLQPPVLAGVAHFGFLYLLPGVRFFDAESMSFLPHGLSFVAKDSYRALNTAMLGILLGAAAMWAGYESGLSKRAASFSRSLILETGLVRPTPRINFIAVGAVLALAVAGWLYSVKLGVFGYSTDAHSLAETQAIRGWVKVATDGGALVLLVLAVAINTDQWRHRGDVWLLFLLVLLWQIALGFLSGFKSQVVMPFIIVGSATYAVRGRVPRAWVVATLLMLAPAFFVVESFREYRHSSRTFDGTSLGSIASTMAEATIDGPRRPRREDLAPAWQRVLARQDVLSFTAEGIAFNTAHGIPPGAPDFLGSIVLSPLNAFIPRALWEEKIQVNDGRWFNTRVLGAPSASLTAIGMGPVAFLNFAGGFPMVFFGFFLIGFIQRVTWDTFRSLGIGGWIVLLGMLPGLVFISSNVGGFLAGFFRQFPFVLVAQYLVLAAPRVVVAHDNASSRRPQRSPPRGEAS